MVSPLLFSRPFIVALPVVLSISLRLAPCTSWRQDAFATLQVVQSVGKSANVSLKMALKPPPVTDPRRRTIGWKDVAKRAGEGCIASFRDGIRRVSVDIPQISSVDRSTTARKFEDDNNFLLSMIEMLPGSKSIVPVGKITRIMEGGFEGGGDYLSDEGLYGYRWNCGGEIGFVTAIGNSEIDSGALRGLQKLDNGSDKVILFNVNLDRLSFFDKIGMPNFDDLETAYVLRRIGPGFLQRQYPETFAIWNIDGGTGGKLKIVDSQLLPYKAQQAEELLRKASQR